MEWPAWWEWELELTPHLFRRMEDRAFSEIDLRRMLENASGFAEDVVPGRFVIFARHANHRWEVIVEPDDAMAMLVVVTAYEAG